MVVVVVARAEWAWIPKCSAATNHPRMRVAAGWLVRFGALRGDGGLGVACVRTAAKGERCSHGEMHGGMRTWTLWHG